jgi:hypothetical protein
MSRIVDNLIAYRVISMLVRPFTETDAYKLGIIDEKGNNLKKTSSLRTSAEKNAYSYLHRLTFNMKKILNRLPGGESRLKSFVAALWLIKEYNQSKDRTTSLMEDKFKKILEKLDEGVILVEEEIEVKKFFSEEVPVNNTAGAAVSEPKIHKKDIAKYQIMARRKPVNATKVKTTKD